MLEMSYQFKTLYDDSKRGEYLPLEESTFTKSFEFLIK